MAQKSSFSKFLKPTYLNYSFIEIILSIIVSFVILILSINYNEESKRKRSYLLQFFSPLAKIVTYPSNQLKLISENVISLIKSNEINLELNKKIEVYEENLNQMYHLKVENNQLKSLLNLKAPPFSDKKSGRIIFGSSSLNSSNIFIDLGKNDGVKLNNPVFNKNGLIGRIINIEDSISEVLLITDNRSVLPVFSIESKSNFFVKGNNSSLNVSHLEDLEFLVDNELILSTSSSGYFKEGIRIGYVKKNQNNILVIPFAKHTDSIYVSVLKYDFEKIQPNFDFK